MNPQKKPILYYRRSWFVQVLISLLFLVFAVLFVPTLMWLLNWPPLGIVILSMVLLCCVLLYGWTIIDMCRKRRDIVCILDERHVEYDIPIYGLGDGCNVALDDITEIIIRNSMIRLRTRDGESHSLSGNFGVPARRIVRLIREMRPEIPLVDH